MAYAGPVKAEDTSARRGPRLTMDGSNNAPHWGGIALFAAGVALGVSVGASIALLYAPDSGRKTRARIRRGSRRAVRRSRDAWDDLGYELRRAIRRRRADRAARREDAELATDL